MGKHFSSRFCRVCTAVLLGAICLAPPVQHLAGSPSEISVPLGERAVIPIGVPGDAAIRSSNREVIGASMLLHGSSHTYDMAVVSRDIGNATVSLKLFGIFPWKVVHVHVVPEQRVYVGGQSIGIRLYSNGVRVIGFSHSDELRQVPRALHLQIGDIIEEINHQRVRTAQDLRKAVGMCGNTPITLLVRRHNRILPVRMVPFTNSSQTAQLGIYVRDHTAGIGTLTFYEPSRHRFGALGHIITDVDTGQPVVGTGPVFRAQVTSVVKGRMGRPGEKKGRFTPHSMAVGSVEKNTEYGVFGDMARIPNHMYFLHPIPVALASQVHLGHAKMLTVVHGEEVQAYDVDIENLARQNSASTKSMIIRVVDPVLLQETGGIIQGMSGSPLLQDGRLIGAVTHVFVSDVTRGYGVYAQWMLQQSQAAPSSVAAVAPWEPQRPPAPAAFSPFN